MVIHNTDIESEDFVEGLELHDSHKRGVSKRRTREMMGVKDNHLTQPHKRKRMSRDSIRKNADWDTLED